MLSTTTILILIVTAHVTCTMALWRVYRIHQLVEQIYCEVKTPDFSATIREIEWERACALDAARHLEAERDAARLQLHEAHAFIRLAITGGQS